MSWCFRGEGGRLTVLFILDSRIQIQGPICPARSVRYPAKSEETGGIGEKMGGVERGIGRIPVRKWAAFREFSGGLFACRNGK